MIDPFRLDAGPGERPARGTGAEVEGRHILQGADVIGHGRAGATNDEAKGNANLHIVEPHTDDVSPRPFMSVQQVAGVAAAHSTDGSKPASVESVASNQSAIAFPRNTRLQPHQFAPPLQLDFLRYFRLVLKTRGAFLVTVQKYADPIELDIGNKIEQRLEVLVSFARIPDNESRAQSDF